MSSGLRSQPEMSAFFGERLGGGRADTLRGAGDQDAFAAQMEIHGITLLMGETSGWMSPLDFNC